MVCFSPYDNVTEFDGTIKQWSYVEKDIRGRGSDSSPFADNENIVKINNVLKHLPFTGNGWYHISLVTWLLDAGILEMKHILYSLEPTLLLPHDYFKKPVEIMINNWDDSKLKKLSINSLIGTMVCRSEPKCYTIRSTNFPYDVPEGGHRMENDVCIDYIF